MIGWSDNSKIGCVEQLSIKSETDLKYFCECSTVCTKYMNHQKMDVFFLNFRFAKGLSPQCKQWRCTYFRYCRSSGATMYQNLTMNSLPKVKATDNVYTENLFHCECKFSAWLMSNATCMELTSAISTHPILSVSVVQSYQEQNSKLNEKIFNFLLIWWGRASIRPNSETRLSHNVCSLLTQGSAWATGGAEYINVIKDLLLNIARGTTDSGILVRNKVHNLDLLQLEIFHQVTQPHCQRASVTSVNSEQGVLMTIDIQAQRSEPRLGPIKLCWVSLSIAALQKGAPGLFFKLLLEVRFNGYQVWSWSPNSTYLDLGFYLPTYKEKRHSRVICCLVCGSSNQ